MVEVDVVEAGVKALVDSVVAAALEVASEAVEASEAALEADVLNKADTNHFLYCQTAFMWWSIVVLSPQEPVC